MSIKSPYSFPFTRRTQFFNLNSTSINVHTKQIWTSSLNLDETNLLYIVLFNLNTFEGECFWFLFSYLFHVSLLLSSCWKRKCNLKTRKAILQGHPFIILNKSNTQYLSIIPLPEKSRTFNRLQGFTNLKIEFLESFLLYYTSWMF